MLKKRSRAVSSKQGLMSDPSSLPSPTGKSSRPAVCSSLFASPRLFGGFSPKGSSDSEATMSPTSTLEIKSFSSIGNPLLIDRNPRKPLTEAAAVNPPGTENRDHPWDNGDSRAIGLGIIDALCDDKPDKQSSRPDSRMVLFGSQLKIQIPSIYANSMSPTGSMKSPKSSQLALFSPAQRSPIGFPNVGSEVPPPSPGVFSGCLLASEMELSEDYTCVIAHGPNPRTTHIFDNCIVESCGDGFTPKENRFSVDCSGFPSDDFLTSCHACKTSLGQGKDIFMYRGEKAFCSSECRYQEMLLDEGMEKTTSDSLGTL